MAGVLGSLVGLAGSGIQAAISTMQKRKGEKMLANVHRPTYYIPAGQNAALSAAETRANAGLPGQGAIQNQLSANTSSGIGAARQAASSSGDVLDAVSKLYGNQNQSVINLGIQAAQFHDKNQQNLENELGTQGQYEDKAFNYNEDGPYQQQLAAAQALIGAGQQGINNAFGNAASIGAAGGNAYKAGGAASAANPSPDDSFSSGGVGSEDGGGTSGGDPGNMGYVGDNAGYLNYLNQA